MRVCLFEDGAELLEPLTLTRPTFDLRCGLGTLGEKLWRFFGATVSSVLVRSHLAELYQEQHADLPVNDWDWLREDAVLLVSGRWLPPELPVDLNRSPSIGLAQGELAFVLADREQVRQLNAENFEETLDHWKRTLPCREVGGRCIGYPWELVEHNGAEICKDFTGPIGRLLPEAQTPLVTVLGPMEKLHVVPSATIEPMVLADTSAGPVIVDDGALVTAFSRLEGPCYIGPFSQVHGAKIRAGTTLGPHCRIGGEVESSIVQGYSNKYHEGFLGHSYLGEWVNLGAGTHNSDLRNDYAPVTVTIHGRPIATGHTKVGCFLGDHTKTGLGTLLNTGTSVGVFCNLLPAGRLAPKYVPSFMNWWNGSLEEGFPLESLLTTAQEVMHRRQCTLTEAHRNLYRHLLAQGAQERRQILGETERRRLRLSA